MFEKHYRYLLFLMILPSQVVLSQGKVSGTQDSAAVDLRVKDLLSRMTLEEKVAQMSMSSLSESVNSPLAFGVLESPFITAQAVALQSIAAKKYARDHTRLGIPPIQIGECLHGQLAAGTTIFPQAIAQGSTWNPALIKEMGSAIASEASASGIDQALSPLFDLIRDPRYGRVEECYAEDPYLVGQMGSAFVIGMLMQPSWGSMRSGCRQRSCATVFRQQSQLCQHSGESFTAV